MNTTTIGPWHLMDLKPGQKHKITNNSYAVLAECDDRGIARIVSMLPEMIQHLQYIDEETKSQDPNMERIQRLAQSILEEVSTDTLQRLANAMVTSGCGGHGKASRNEAAAREYRLELENAGVAIPSNEELYKIGIFNGPGSQ